MSVNRLLLDTALDDMRNLFGLHAVNKDKPIRKLKNIFITAPTYRMQSMIGQTDTHSVQPVQSSLTCGKCVSLSNSIAW